MKTGTSTRQRTERATLTLEGPDASPLADRAGRRVAGRGGDERRTTGDCVQVVVPWDPITTADNRVRCLHHQARANLYRRAREAGRLAWLASGGERLTGPVRVSLHVRRARVCDLMNLWGGAKPVADGVFNDALLPNDGPEFLRELGPVTLERGKQWKGREECVFTVEPL